LLIRTAAPSYGSNIGVNAVAYTSSVQCYLSNKCASFQSYRAFHNLSAASMFLDNVSPCSTGQLYKGWCDDSAVSSCAVCLSQCLTLMVRAFIGMSRWPWGPLSGQYYGIGVWRGIPMHCYWGIHSFACVYLCGRDRCSLIETAVCKYYSSYVNFAARRRNLVGRRSTHWETSG